ncbi:toxin-antitoxin system, toxin component family protein [Streptomyces sp. NPDC047085]|uniref:toxin-antitoxin system, toxin component family protein n=1 Tax=Streptomyces sp. NPDC047085 TaxID=3155140 RepID=UPI0033E55CCD
MAFAGGARRRAAQVAARLVRPRPGSSRRSLAAGLAAAVRARPQPPHGVRELCRALCEEMSARRGGRPVELRFERFPDEIEVTGLWVEFQDFDLVIVEERAEAVQQLVILGHELWHLHAGHRHHAPAGEAAAQALADEPGWRERALADEPGWRERALAAGPGWRERALTVAARNGSRAAEEAEADEFGHRLATLFRPYLTERAPDAPLGPLDPVQRSLGYRGRGGAAR